jgi:hypothetical protein
MIDYRTRFRWFPRLARRNPEPDARLAAEVARTQGKDKKYQAAQLHAAPLSFLFQAPTLPAGLGVNFQAVGVIYTAETTQLISLIRFSVSAFNLWPWSLTGFISKVADLGAIAAGLGGDVIVTEGRAINGVNKVEGQEVYPADIEAPMQHYLNAGESVYFGVLSQYDTPPAQLVGQVIFGEAVVKYIVTGRNFV